MRPKMQKPISYSVKVGIQGRRGGTWFWLGNWQTKAAARSNLKKWIAKNPKSNFGTIIEVFK